ncbi:hypothetical protein Tcan_11447 [Toxocara canis]|uniref:Uncharacterized protein n=1 Tax=Toxocara canis TaxID=6265 RepID=A0A0B2VPX6_TOXCA|nr:hypothetical protein Tcan_11447 [Toxocara canis]
MYMVIVMQLAKMAHKRQTISSKFADDKSTSSTGHGGGHLFMKRINSIESFRHSVEFALLLSCFINWIGTLLEQLFINWLYFEGELRNFLIVLFFLTQCWMNTLMRIFLSRLLRHKMRTMLALCSPFRFDLFAVA